MQTGRSVQFQQVEDIIAAYQLRKVAAFSVYQGKQLLMKYEGEDIEAGADLLGQFLECITSSAAIYTLCVYEEFTGKINDKTPYHGSWNFRFQENTAGYNANGNAIAKQLQLINERIDAIGSKEEGDEPDAVLDTMDRIGEITNHPLVEKFLPMILGALKIPIPGYNEKNLMGAVMSGVNDAPVVGPALIGAIQKMLKAVPSCEKKFIELGEIADKDPMKFAKLVGYLNMI